MSESNLKNYRGERLLVSVSGRVVAVTNVTWNSESTQERINGSIDMVVTSPEDREFVFGTDEMNSHPDLTVYLQNQRGQDLRYIFHDVQFNSSRSSFHREDDEYTERFGFTSSNLTTKAG